MSENSTGAAGARDTLRVGDQSYDIFRLDSVPGASRLPFSLKVLLENLLRHQGGLHVSAADVQALADWDPQAEPSVEIQYTPARVLMQDFTGVPCIVDLAAMREAMAALGGDAEKINPLAPAELVIDHSVIADVFGGPDSFEINAALEFSRNEERYQFLRWGQSAFDDFVVVPPDTGIVHQVNLERLARVVFVRDGVAYPDTVVGTDSHTTMINGLGVLGWGVGGIEAEAAMLGQPVSMLIPKVVGFKLVGELPPGTTATDMVLTVTEMLRKHGVVGKIVEFYGEGLGNVPLANRATIGNMSPEYGSTAAMFPIDDETLAYLRLSGRPAEQVALVEAYAKEQGLWHDPANEPVFSETLELDLSTVVPSIAGPKRPQDRVPLNAAKSMFRAALRDYATHPGPGPSGTLDEAEKASFPASDPISASHDSAADQPVSCNVGPVGDRPSNPVQTVLADGSTATLDHGAVVIAAITSCTNTSNPYVMIGAALLAKRAVELGLSTKPWVKTTLAPGSKVVMDYYDRAGLTPYLEKLGFSLVGYGCTTCIGNSGPLPAEVSAAVNEGDLAVTSVLSGNRNFEGRINPDVKMNYLASPPLVVAYALAGTMDMDLTTEPLGTSPDGTPVLLADIWPSEVEVARVVAESISSDQFDASYADVFAGDARWQGLQFASGDTFGWDENSTYVRRPPYFDGMPAQPAPVTDVVGARVLAPAGRQRHHRPHQPGRQHPAGLTGREIPGRARGRGERLQLLRLAPGQPRGHDPRDLRQHPAAQPARSWHRGRGHARPAQRRADHHLRSGTVVCRRRHTAGGAGRQGIRQWIVAGLGCEGDRATRGQGGHCRVVRADSPLQPDRYGGPAAAVRRRRECVLARPDRPRELRRARHRRASAHAGSPGHRTRRQGHDLHRDRSHRHTGEQAYYRHGGILQYVLRSLVAPAGRG